MILGIGTDTLEVRRVERELMRGGWVPEDGVFTTGEIRHCGSALNPAERYACCFVAKEAALKALGLGADDLGVFREVEVRAAADGKHEIAFLGRVKAAAEQLGARNIRLSISVDARQAVAIVVLQD